MTTCTCHQVWDLVAQVYTVEYCPLHGAAPTLLEALEALWDAVIEIPTVDDRALTPYMAQASAAIQKATGGGSHE